MNKWKNMKQAAKMTKATWKLSKAPKKVKESVHTMRYQVGAVVIRTGEKIQGPAHTERGIGASSATNAVEKVTSLKHRQPAKQEEPSPKEHAEGTWNEEEEYEEAESGSPKRSASQPAKTKKKIKKAASA